MERVYHFLTLCFRYVPLMLVHVENFGKIAHNFSRFDLIFCRYEFLNSQETTIIKLTLQIVLSVFMVKCVEFFYGYL